MESNGSLIFDTQINTDGVSKGLNDVKNGFSGVASTAVEMSRSVTAAFSAASAAATKTSADSSASAAQISAALKSSSQYKSDVLKLAQTYKSQGMDMSAAMKKAYAEIDKSQYETSSNAQKNAKKFADSWEKAESSVGGLADKIKNGLGTAAKTATVAIGAAATGIAAITKSAVENYGNYEQLVGGVETLFKDSADVVQEYAANAYKTAGMSANDYMETVTSFSASLLQSLGNDTEKAAAVADKAITDMADNANKMGTPMESIQNAYQGFAKQNYTMLDNLKLGFGGTKEEMQRLLDTANEYNRQQGINTNYQIESYADIVEAIHVVQTEMGISGITAEEAAEMVASGAMTQEETFEAMGTTAKEAATTIQGSLSSVGAAWQNLLTGIADENVDFDTLIANFVDSAATALDNLLPRVKTTLEGVGELVTELSPVIAEAIPELVDDVLPSIVQAAVDLVTTLVNSLVDNGGTVADTALDIIDMLVKALEDNAYGITDGAITLITTLVNGISDRLPELIPAAVEIILSIAEALINNIDEILDAAEAIITELANGLMEAIPVLLEKAAPIVTSLLGELVKAIPDVIEFAVVLCQNIADYIINYDWDEVGSNLYDNVAKAINNALHGDSNYTDQMAEDAAKRIEAYSKLSAERLESMITWTSRKIGEYNKVLTDGMNSGIYDIEAMPQWMRIAYENSGKTLEAFLSDNIAALQKNFEEYSAAKQNVIDALNAPIDVEHSGARTAAEAMAAEYTKKYQEAQKASEDGAIDLAEQEKENLRLLQEGWESLEHDYAVGAIATEAELYDKKKALWNEYGNASLKDHWKYIEDISKYDKDFAEEQIKLAQKEADEKQRIQDEENKKAEDERKASIDRQEEIVSDGLSDIIKVYRNAYDELDKKREAYRQKLMSVGGDLFSVDVTTDETGKKTTAYTVNNLDEQLRKMREYNSAVKSLMKQGASDELISQLTSMNDEDSMQFAKYLSGMSASEFAKINELYNEKQKLADELANDLYKNDAQMISDSYTNALADLAVSSYEYGVQAAEEFSKGFNASMDKLGASSLYNQMQASEANQTYQNYWTAKETEQKIEVTVTPGKTYVVADGKVIGESTTTYQTEQKRIKGK